MTHPTALAVIARTPEILRSIFASAAPDDIDDPRDDGWSARDVLAHILDVEDDVLAGRIQRMIDEDTPFIRSIDAPARVAAGGYAARTVADLLDDLAARRARHVEWLRALTPDQLSRPGRHDHAGPIIAADIAHQWAYHDLLHLKQIASILQAGLVAHMGNTRRFYDV